MSEQDHLPEFVAPAWSEYALLDSGAGRKLEQFGAYLVDRPEPAAAWRTASPQDAWRAADAVFHSHENSERGRWELRTALPDQWQMQYGRLRFWARATPFRHMGVFPEQAVHWDWLAALVAAAPAPVRVLNLFGYTGLATLAAAAAGAHVTHVDAARKAVAWARTNQALSGLTDRPVRWIVDDALKFVAREVRRRSLYEGIILDPPKFGRGPRGELWQLDRSLPDLLDLCSRLLSDQALFMVLTTYPVRLADLRLYAPVRALHAARGGELTIGTLAIAEQSAGRTLPAALFARWRQ